MSGPVESDDGPPKLVTKTVDEVHLKQVVETNSDGEEAAAQNGVPEGGKYREEIVSIRHMLDDIEGSLGDDSEGGNTAARSVGESWLALAHSMMEKAFKPSVYQKFTGSTSEVQAKSVVKILANTMKLFSTRSREESAQLLDTIQSDVTLASRQHPPTAADLTTIPVFVQPISSSDTSGGTDLGGDKETFKAKLRQIWEDDVDFIVVAVEAVTNRNYCTVHLLGDRLKAKGFVSKYNNSRTLPEGSDQVQRSTTLLFTLDRAEVDESLNLRRPTMSVLTSAPTNDSAPPRQEAKTDLLLGSSSGRFIALDDSEVKRDPGTDTSSSRSRKSTTVYASGFPQHMMRESLEDIWSEDRNFRVIDLSFVQYKPAGSRQEEKYALIEVAGNDEEAMRFIRSYDNARVDVRGRSYRLFFTLRRSKVDPRVGGKEQSDTTCPDIQLIGDDKVKVFFGGLSRHVRKTDLMDLWSKDRSVRYHSIVMNTKGTPRTAVGILYASAEAAMAFVDKYNGMFLSSQGETCTIRVGFQTFADREFWEELDYPVRSSKTVVTSSSTTAGGGGSGGGDDDDDRPISRRDYKNAEGGVSTTNSSSSTECQPGEGRVIVYGLPQSYDEDEATMEKFLSKTCRGMYSLSRVVFLPFGANLEMGIGSGTWKKQASTCVCVFVKGSYETAVGFARKFTGLKGLPGHPFTILHMEEVLPSVRVPGFHSSAKLSSRVIDKGERGRIVTGFEDDENEAQNGEVKIFFWGMVNGRLAGERTADERLIAQFLRQNMDKGGFSNPIRVLLPKEGLSKKERDFLGLGNLGTLSGYVFVKGNRDTAIGFCRKFDDLVFRYGKFVFRTGYEEGLNPRLESGRREVDAEHRRRRRSRSAGEEELGRARSPPRVVPEPTRQPTTDLHVGNLQAPLVEPAAVFQQQYLAASPVTMVPPLPGTNALVSFPYGSTTAGVAGHPQLQQPPQQQQQQQQQSSQLNMDPLTLQQQYEAYLRSVQMLQQQQQQQQQQ